MAKKELKTNAVRILERNKIDYELINYECDEFIDGIHTAEATGAPIEQSFKTLVMKGKSNAYYVFVIPIADEVNLKAAARSVKEKSVEITIARLYQRYKNLVENTWLNGAVC